MKSPEIKSFFSTALFLGFGGVGFLSFIITLLMLVMPIYMMTVISKVLTSQSEATLWGLTGIALFLLLILGIVIAIRGRVLTRIGEEFDLTIGKSVFTSMIHKNCIQSQGAGILDSLDSVKRFLANDAVTSFFDVPFVPIFLVVIWALHPVLGKIALVSTFLMLALTFLADRRAKRKLEQAQPESAKARSRASQYANHSETLKVHGMIDIAADRWWASRARAWDGELPGQDAMSDSQGILRAGMFFFPVVLLCAGALLVMNGELGVGALVAVNILMMRTVAPLQASLAGWKHFVEAKQSLNRLDEFLGEYAEFNEKMQATLPEPKIEVLVEGLVSRPPARDALPILKGLSFKLLPGESLGVVGASGAGKTTLLKHLVGLQVPAKGHVKFDGIPSWQWDTVVLGPHLGYMGQDSELFEGTIAENIARFQNHDIAEVTNAAEIAGMHHRIAALSNGYDTLITTEKTTLSGGEKQAVTLVRAIFRMPKLVVLDEPTASMDLKGQEAVKLCINKLKAAGTTVIVSSHQPQLLNGLDKLLFIQFGKQIAFGSPGEVIPKIQRGT